MCFIILLKLKNSNTNKRLILCPVNLYFQVATLVKPSENKKKEERKEEGGEEGEGSDGEWGGERWRVKS